MSEELVEELVLELSCKHSWNFHSLTDHHCNSTESLDCLSSLKHSPLNSCCSFLLGCIPHHHYILDEPENQLVPMTLDRDDDI